MGLDFDAAFVGLTGFATLKWQRRLFEQFVSDHLPDTCDLPTGLGKTSVVVIWLLALAEQCNIGQVRLPRRLVYIVNRRTVVDQATTVVEGVRRRLMQPAAPEWQQHKMTLDTIRAVLRELCAFDGTPLAVSTLRGELADNEEWKADPARAGIVIGTIDMIGSKLLFSGYGDGAYNRAHHAGLIGQDTLIVHDEAHLTPAFGDLLRAIAEEQRKSDPRPVRVIELSATSRQGGERVFTLKPEDEQDEIVRQRLTATKILRLHRVPDDSVTRKMVDISNSHERSGSRVLIYVLNPTRAQDVASALANALGKNAAERVAILTGTIRGHERDQLVKINPVYRAFLNATPVEKTVYLVSTSAGEVGIDLDADHMVCDRTTLDALIQRLGRVNRRGGEGRCADIGLVGDVNLDANLSDVERAINSTLELVAGWAQESGNGIDVSPGNLGRLLMATEPERIRTAFSPKPQALPLTDVLLDAWSLTSVDKMPGRPRVAAFLHGLTQDPPETFVAWRKEITFLRNSEIDGEPLREWFRACRIDARERLRDRTDRVIDFLANLLKKHRKKRKSADFPVVALDERGDARWHQLSEITTKEFELDFRTVVLPIEAGGLSSHGMLDATAVDPAEGLAVDVAEAKEGNRRERWLHRRSAGVEQYERLLTAEIFDRAPADTREKERLPLLEPVEDDEQAETVDLLLLVLPEDSVLENPETASGQQTLEIHTDHVAAAISAITGRVNLPEPEREIRSALIAAARWHDRGKNRFIWQRYARNKDLSRPLAKSKSYLHPRALGGYRHEFGSLLEACADPELRRCAACDLMLHLVAAHHGWGRPHFEPRSFDNTYTTGDNTCSAYEAMRRFEQLQQHFGRWGLAWLESLLRCADIVASREALLPAGERAGQKTGL